MQDVLIEILAREWTALNAIARTCRRCSDYLRDHRDDIASRHVDSVTTRQQCYRVIADRLPNGTKHGIMRIYRDCRPAADINMHYSFGIPTAATDLCGRRFVLRDGITYIYIRGELHSVRFRTEYFHYSMRWEKTVMRIILITMTHGDDPSAEVDYIDPPNYPHDIAQCLASEARKLTPNRLPLLELTSDLIDGCGSKELTGCGAHVGKRLSSVVANNYHR